MRGGDEVAIFVLRRGRTEVLVCRRTDPTNRYWHTIAGGVEPGATPADAAVRELREETGLVATLAAGRRTSYDYPLSEEAPQRRALYARGIESVHVECFVADAPADWEPQLDDEHDEYRWCSPDDAFALLYWDDTREALRMLLS
jgi:8-oxo-dGTP pyrophosphatase MutT (NUDIX family)